MSRQYMHVPLSSPRHIRLVVLLPAENHAAPLNFCIVETTLDQPLPYAALSYSWDAPAGSTKLDCGNGVLPVTPNCEAALRYLRGKTYSRLMWIDSICIDQTEDAIGERNHQVSFMGEIFKKADTVIIWLGEMDDDTRIAMLAVENVINQPQRFESSAELKLRLRALSTGITSAAEDPFRPISRRSWFYRIWTIQEAVLGRSDRVIVGCGSAIVPWVHLVQLGLAMEVTAYSWDICARAMRLQTRLLASVLSLEQGAYEQQLFESANILAPSAQSAPRAEGYRSSLCLIFDEARDKLATNPKDKVFALYGILQELQFEMPQPDYKKTVQRIYKESVVATIKHDQSLFVLYCVPTASRRPGLASWVPDWSQPAWKEPDHRHCFSYKQFAAAKDSRGGWRFSPDADRLIVSGIIFDSVAFRLEGVTEDYRLGNIWRDRNLRDMISPRDDILDAHRETFEIMTAWVKSNPGNCYPTGEDWEKALLRTLLMDKPTFASLYAEFNAYNPWLRATTASDLEFVKIGVENINAADPNRPLPGDEAHLKVYLEFQTPTQLFSKVWRSIWKFHLAAESHCRHKCFFHTKKGYFGLAPDPLPTPAAPGDVIAVVQGMEMPLLLRPVDGGYRLITHVYVHGIMYGEAWPDDANELEEIVLI
ncbi:hypothetical protein A1O7_03325 [Cladophialophora yegresii CBS 114405]|uniref:Heterokaryon incompatibility domain-containing protein n=1 Tax=Cladophialophora yegresii CBS 114405 TaxID=1182544 RepID=W9W4L2_9EURO|nr:uncharacterized protein A1O7_03325 [Cladophialophora yegresii CBS 114405]EXJ62883.1 hypothetical protein A1O7_03325 [Cladophialophora yegresii CBS 114405]